MAQELVIDVHGHEISIHARGTILRRPIGKAMLLGLYIPN
jgi:hypothetical protein